MLDHFAGKTRSEVSRDCVPFVVVGRSRTGSNLLRSLLNAHPQVEVYGEVFQNLGATEWDHLGILKRPSVARLRIDDPLSFLEDNLFRCHLKGVQAVGFKLFYYHAREGKWQTVWSYLQGKTDLRVIHMRRRNLLETHLSRKRAELTDSWVNTTGRLEASPVVELDYDECLADFQRTRASEEECNRFFSGRRTLEVYYEDLASDHPAMIKKVFGFLGVPPASVAPGIFKQSHQTLREAVKNYSELKERFAGSAWAGFFVD